LYDPQRHRASAFLYGDDAGVVCHSIAAWTLWFLGYPDQGLARSHEALTLGQRVAHPFSLAFALVLAAMFHAFRCEKRCTQERAEAAISLSKEQGFPIWMAVGSLLHGWALTQQGQGQEGIAQMTQALSAYCATGAENLRPYWLAFLGDAYRTMGQPEA